MNRPPVESTPVQAAALREFVAQVFGRAGVPEEQAAMLADLLVTNDLRGVFSHGTRQVPAYVGHFREGRLTPAPQIEVTQESPSTLMVDGGGGLGYFAAHRAATLLGPKALDTGIATALTRKHGHIGAAGIYSRIPLEHGLFCFVTSGHQLDLQPGQPMLTAAGGSPMSFAIPTGEEPPFVLDFGAMHDLYPGSPHVFKVAELASSTVFRSFGLGCVCQALGGFLAGVPVDPARAQRRWPGANQGSFMIAVDLRRFGALDLFQREMDEYARRVRELEPLPGYEEAVLAGGLEWERERQFGKDGIQIGIGHAERLRELAETFGLDSPV
jgi:LDH2 family malate/lactate/ureidoglycolate dehydrogenase